MSQSLALEVYASSRPGNRFSHADARTMTAMV
jgi:hypothetical protein